MSSETTIPPERVIKARGGLIGLDLAEFFRHRELLLFLSWRDIIVRYKQTVVGILWAVIQPVLTTLIFTIIFGKIAKMESNGEVYAVMVLSGVLPWQYFSSAMGKSSASVVGASGMISKVYFPRLIIPATATISGLADFLITFLILIGMMIYYDVPLRPTLLLIPVFLSIAIAAAFGIGLWFSALNVKYRDVRYIIPFITRMGLYVSPVAFLSTTIPEEWRLLYNLNPMVAVIDGFRWAVFGPEFMPYWPGLGLSLFVISIILISGAYYFRYFERTFVDYI